MTKKSTNIVVLGAGPAGYVAAFLAADQGFEVTLVDPRGSLGGTCLHEGCIPSKALLHIANIIQSAEKASDFGITFSPPRLDIEKIRSFQKNIIQKLSSGLMQLSRMRKIHFIEAHACFVNNRTLCLTKPNHKNENLSFKKCIIATGARPNQPSAINFSNPEIITSREALSLSTIPDRLLVVGGGYIGLEMATIFANLGSQVTVCEIKSALLSGIDPDLVNIAEKTIQRKITILCSTKIESIQENTKGLKVILKNILGETDIQFFQKILIATGRTPNSNSIGLSCTKIKTDIDGFIQTNSFGQTNEKNIYAIGDVRGGPQLAHKASAEAQALAQTLKGKKTCFPKKQSIPYAVYTNPEIAFCGLSEEEARKQFSEVKIIKIPWASSGRALSIDQCNGLTKMIFDTREKKLLGIGIVGTEACELIGSANLAMALNAKAKQIAKTIFPHPSLIEMFREVAENFLEINPHAIKRSKQEV